MTFKGRIGNVMGASEPAWPDRPRAAGKPNVVVILVDDVGFADIGCFGGEIDTPNLDRIAAEGLRYTNFHVNPMCSPTRASLLTGLNCHNVGFGHVANSDPGFPGYFCELPENVSTLAEMLRAQGYSTLMTGKWHLARDADISAVGPKHSWPCQRGFDRFYGILDAFTNLHHPHYLVEDNHVVEVDRYPNGYYLTDDLTDKAIKLIKETKATDAGKPFLLYLAHPGAHAPLLAKAPDIAKYEDRYRVGWDVLREQRFARQRELGVIPAHAELAPRNTEPTGVVTPWAELTEAQRELYARHMAVYAAMVDAVDQSVGRLRAELESIGEWDNTVLLFLSDNGASKEGETVGTTSYYNDLKPMGPFRDEPLPSDYARLQEIGGPKVMAHYPRGWAMLGNTPFRLYKTFTHAGGHQVPCIAHVPGRIADPGGLRNQYLHVIDVVPTLLDLLGFEPPATRQGEPVKPIQGRSFVPTLGEGSAPTPRAEQYYELGGNRAYMHDGWEIVTLHEPLTPFSDEEWELFDLNTDPTQVHDLRADHPDRLAELAEGWECAARANQVYPLDEGSGFRWVVRAPEVEYFEKPITLWPGTATLEPWRSRRLIWMRSFTITVDITIGAASDQGVLVAHGDQGGGYVLYVEDGRVHWAYNDGRGTMHTVDGGLLGTGRRSVLVTVNARAGRRWDVMLSVDGTDRGTLGDLPQLFPMAPFEGITVGTDRRSPVSWSMHERHGVFPFTGTLHAVRYVPGELVEDAPVKFLPFMRQMAAKFE